MASGSIRQEITSNLMALPSTNFLSPDIPDAQQPVNGRVRYQSPPIQRNSYIVDNANSYNDPISGENAIRAQISFQGSDPFRSYWHATNLPNSEVARLMLNKVASIVRPIMRRRRWTVGALMELTVPRNGSLVTWGLNQGHGQAIFVRLRHPDNAWVFLPLGQILETMLHEMAHNAHCGHGHEFHACLRELKMELEGLKKMYRRLANTGRGYPLITIVDPAYQVQQRVNMATQTSQELRTHSEHWSDSLHQDYCADVGHCVANAVDSGSRLPAAYATRTREVATIVRGAFKPCNRKNTTNPQDDEEDLAEALRELTLQDKAKKVGLPPLKTSDGGNINCTVASRKSSHYSFNGMAVERSGSQRLSYAAQPTVITTATVSYQANRNHHRVQ